MVFPIPSRSTVCPYSSSDLLTPPTASCLRFSLRCQSNAPATLRQTLGGAASGGADALLRQSYLGGLAAAVDGDDLERRRFEARLGYGFAAFGDRFTSTPELGLGLSDGHREYSLGWRLDLAQSGPTSLELQLETTRREATAANDNQPPVNGIGFRLTARW